MDIMLYVLEICVRMLLLSGILLVAYVVFLRRKADYRMCRRLLLSVPFFCLAVPAIHFAFGQLSELREPRQVVMTKSEADEYIRAMSAEDVVSTALQAVRQSVPLSEPVNFERSLRVALRGIPMVSALLLILMGGQLLLLHVRCRRMARRSPAAEGGIVRSPEIETPFSFGDRIFLPSERLTPGGERMVVMHERAHIRLGHSAEGLLMEVLCRLLWFNPFVWMARKELRDVQEFEADRQVLDAGTEILTYQTLLLEETMKECPVFADGFNRSFVRRRFVEMKSAGRRKSSPALRWLVVFIVVGVTGMASAGYGRQAVELKIVDDAVSSVVSAPAAQDSPAEVVPQQGETVADGVRRKDAGEDSSGPKVRAAEPEDGRPSSIGGYPVLYDLPLATGKNFVGMYMRNTESETLLVFERIVQGDNEFFKFGGPGCYLVDCATGVHYQARRSVPAEAWGQFFLRGMKGKKVTVTVVFPRLPDNVREVGMYCVTSQLQSDHRVMVKDMLVK